MLAGFLLGICSVSQVCTAQESLPDFYKEPGIYPNRDYINQHVTENVDPFTGSLQIQSTDIYLPGNGDFDLRVVRSYNSTRINPLNPADASTSSLAGMGWTIHFGRVLRSRNSNPCATGFVSVKDNPVLELPDGSRQVLARSADTSILWISTQRWRAECWGAGTGLSVYSPDGVRYDMTQAVAEVGGPNPIYAWYTTAITDRNGNSATVNYAAPATPEISSVSTSDGRSLRFGYLDAGTLNRRIQTIISGTRTWTYVYQPVSGVAGRYFLTQVIRPDAAQTKWGYAYNTIVSSDNPNNYQLRQLTYPQGGTITYGYGHVYFDRTTNPSTRSVCVTSKSSSDGGSWSFSYTPGSYNSYDTTVASTPAGSITYKHIGASYGVQPFVWSIGLLVQRTAGGVQTETYAWGKQTISNQTNTRVGAFTQFSDPAVYAPVLTQRTIVRDGVTYQTTYSNHDAYGNPQTVAEAGSYAGNRTTNLSYYINTGKWIVRQVQNETTVGVGSVTRGFDGNGNLLSESHDGVRTGYSRYSTGDIYVKTPPRGAIGAITYSNYYRGIPQTEAQPEGVTISRVVNDAGDVTSQTDGEQKTTAYSYDGLHQLTLITPPVGNATTISYTATAKTATRGSSPELVQTTTLDGFGRIVNVTTGGVAVARQYDALGRKIFASIMGFTSVGHSYLYDILNRVTRITHSADGSWRGYTYGNSSGSAKVDVRDERGNTTTYTYRAYGDPDRNFVMGVSTPVAAASVAIRRNGRDLVTQVTQGGVTRSYGYDSRYYLTSSVQPEVGTTTYGRDNAGNMASKQVGSSGSTVFEYDGRNRPWRVTYPNGNPSQVVSTYWRTDKLKTVTNAVATRSYGYDANQNLISESLVVDGLTMTAGYNYNGNDQLASIVYPVMGRTVQFNPNVLGRPTSIVTPAGSMLATGFWPNGQIYDIAFAGGSRVTYGQNGREWLNSVTVQTGDGISRIASTLGHDVAGNLGTVTDSADASYNRTLGFDGINRLTVINGPWGNGALAYDGAGNRTSYTLGAQTRSYSYDSQQRLVSLALNRAFGGVTTSYGYDTYGNAFPSTNTYAYDNASNLTSTITGRFSYDGLNTRVKTVVSYVTTYEFRSAQGLLLAEWQKEPGYYDTLKEHMHLAGKEVAEQRTQFLGGDIRPVTWMFLQPDASGSPLASTWAGGGLLFKENYRPYGSQINGTAKAYTQRAFAGQTQDEYELIYMGGRYYNPVAGRFLSMDPKEADPSDPHGINRYAYANNNPYRYVDPDGHSPVDLAFLAIDTVQLARALYNGEGRGEAAINFGISVVGVVSPLVGTGQLIKALRVADKAEEGAEAAGHAVLAAKGEAALTSRAARREAMREAGIPTSQQPVSQSRNASGREYSYDVPAPGGGTQRMSVQQQTMDRSHPGQAHWEAGRVKTDPRTGAIRESNYGRPALTNDKSKVDY